MLSYEYKKRVVETIRQHFESERNASPEGAGENERMANVFKFLLLPRFESQTPVSAGALVELELAAAGSQRGIRALYFLVPTGGGLVTSVEGAAIQVVTDQSPIGGALLGKCVGEQIVVESRGQQRLYRLTEIC